MPDRRPARDRRLGRITFGAFLAAGLSLAAAAPASAQFQFGSFATQGDATAGWVDEPDAPLGSTDQQSMQLFVNGTGPTDFNDSALVAFEGFSSTPEQSPPSFDFKVSATGGSGGSVRFVMRFSDGGRGELRPVTLQAGQWTHVDGAQPDWDNGGGSCGDRTSQTYAQVLACHAGAAVTNIEVINDSGWLHPGGFQVLADNVSYGGATVSKLPPPVLGERITVTQVSGDILVDTAARARASRVGARAAQTVGAASLHLDGSTSVPPATLVNSVAGNVKLESARGGSRTQSGNFTRGRFRIEQSHSSRGLVTLVLRGSLGCGTSGASATAASGERAETARRRRRRLWGRGRGRFRTRGRLSSATVRGTKWVTVDRCDGTLTVVREGVVAVRDFRRKKTIELHAGGRYLARRR